jgi:hypothetical protein
MTEHISSKTTADLSLTMARPDKRMPDQRDVWCVADAIEGAKTGRPSASC